MWRHTGERSQFSAYPLPSIAGWSSVRASAASHMSRHGHIRTCGVAVVHPTEAGVCAERFHSAPTPALAPSLPTDCG
jgi:hypothetical protein